MTTPSSSPAPRWRFTSLGEDTVITATGLAAVGIFAGTAALTFGPLALGAATLYAAWNLGRSYGAMFLPALRHRALDSIRRSAHYREVAPDSAIARIVAEQSARLDLKNPPAVFYIGEQVIAAMLPPWARRTLDDPKTRQRALTQSFYAVPGLNIIMTTGEALAAMTDERLAFVTAHEIAHLKKDRLSLPLHVKSIKTPLTLALAVAAVAGIALPLAGVALPIFTGSALTAAAGLIAASSIATMVNNIGIRALERRADRNALYLQQKDPSLESSIAAFKTARIALEQIHGRPLSSTRKEPLWSEIANTHPGQWRRDDALKKSFAKVLRYAAPHADAAEELRTIDAALAASPVIWWRQSA